MATVKALLWFNAINQYRRIFGNFILPIFVLGISLVVNFFINEEYSRSELPPDVGEECAQYTYCSVTQVQFLTSENGTRIAQTYMKDEIQMPPGSTLNALVLLITKIDM